MKDLLFNSLIQLVSVVNDVARAVTHQILHSDLGQKGFSCLVEMMMVFHGTLHGQMELDIEQQFAVIAACTLIFQK